MKPKLISIAVLVFLFFLMGSAKSWGFSSEDDYLWIEFGECVREKDGTLSLTLQVNFGRFPDEKKEISQLHGFRAFYALAEEEDDAKEIFYEAKIERGEKGHWINIKSYKAQRFIVLVGARRSQGQVVQRYFAKTSFVLFGHSFLRRGKIVPSPLPSPLWREGVTRGIPSPPWGEGVTRGIPAPLWREGVTRGIPSPPWGVGVTRGIPSPLWGVGEGEGKLEIFTNPQFHYWPQTGNPIKITPLFNQGQLGSEVLYIFDENGDSIDIKTDETGGFTYIPPEDKKLNRKGETAFKQVVIVTGQIQGNINCVSSYTILLHRSRFKNCRLLPGFSIFFGTMLGVFSLAVAQRKRFKF